MCKYIKSLLLLALITTSYKAFNQAIPEHVSHTDIYEFMDELASEKLFIVNSAVKPYTKSFIVKSLQQAVAADSLLNKRQKKELEFYLNAYQIWDNKKQNPYRDEKINLLKKHSEHSAISLTHAGFVHRDSNFTVVARPIWGTRYYTNSNENLTHYWGGEGAEAKIGKHLSIYASVRDNSISEILAWPGNLTQAVGGNYKLGNGGRSGGDYSEMRGGAAFEWRWGNIAIEKNHIQWGDNQNGTNIIDSRSPSFASIKLHLNPTWWFEFDYLHGWLVSEDIDSLQSYTSIYGESREVFRPKFIAANMYTLHPWKHLSLSAGNSIIYSDIGGAHPAYMIPFAFFKSIDHTLNHGIQNQNSQMFFNVSIRNIRHLHLYGSLFVDELSLDRVGNDSAHNFLSWKGGLQLRNWPIGNVSVSYEYTQTYPLTYKHRIEATTFETNRFGLGHYLSDNSKEHYAALQIKPFAKFKIKASYQVATHYNQYAYDPSNDIRLDEYPVWKDKTWQNKTFALSLSYEFLQNVTAKITYQDSNIKGFDADGKTAQNYLNAFTPAYFQGAQKTWIIQFNFGF